MDRLRVWGKRAAVVGSAAAGVLAGGGVCLAEAPDVTAYTSAVGDIMSGVTTAVPTMITSLAAMICGLALVRIGVGFVRRFAK